MIHRGLTQTKVEKKFNRDIDEKLLVVTLGVNCLKYTRRCIETLRTRAKHVTFIYIDNGSKPENVEEIKKWKKNNQNIDEFLIHFNGHNLGVAPGWNQGIRYGIANGFTKIMIVNNDIAFGEHTIDGLFESFKILKQSHPETVMVTAANRTKNPADLATVKPEAKFQEHPDFSCFMIEPSFVEKIGFICEDYKPAFFEDNDTHWRILLSGYKAFSSNLAPYSHIASRTRYENPDLVSHVQFRKNKIVFSRNFLTISVNQEIANERYRDWLKRNPDTVHPKPIDVINSYAYPNGFRESINALTVDNVPLE